MTDYLQSQIARASRGVLFDTNVFLAFLVGAWDIKRFASFKRLEAYNEEDFSLLFGLVQLCGTLTVTPGILAEACNLTDGLNRQNNHQIFATIRELASEANDRRKESRLICSSPSFIRLGYTDAGVIDCSLSGTLVVTDDLHCYREAVGRNGIAVNINHLRSARWIAGS